MSKTLFNKAVGKSKFSSGKRLPIKKYPNPNVLSLPVSIIEQDA